MEPAVASLIGAAIGALAGLLGGVLTGRRQAELEKEKWLQAREDDIKKDTRLALAELTRKMAAVTQAMLWFTAKAVNTPDKLTQEDILDYDKEVQRLLPDILGSLMVISALNKKLQDEMQVLVQRIYEVDFLLAQASKDFDASPESTAEAIGKVSSNVSRLQDELLNSISGIIGGAAPHARGSL